MILNYDCLCEIAKHLKNSYHLQFCHLYDIQITMDNLTNKFYIFIHIMDIHCLNLDLVEILKTLNWESVSNHQGLFEELMYEFCEQSDWEQIFGYTNMNWHRIVQPWQFPKEYIKEFDNGNVIWFYVSKSEILSEDFIRRYQDNVNWFAISKYQELSERFIEEFKEKVEWMHISIHQKLSENFIRKFIHSIDWSQISCFQALSEDFIRDFENKVNWCYISSRQTLSEEFIREFCDLVHWPSISKHQNLSLHFIKEFKRKIDWEKLSHNTNVSERVFRKLRIWKAIHPVIPYVTWMKESRFLYFGIFKMRLLQLTLDITTSVASYIIATLLGIDDLDF